MPLHDKIDEAHLQANGLLLSATELELVKTTQQFMEQMQAKATPLLAQQKALDVRKSELSDLMDIIHSPTRAIDVILNKALHDSEKTPIKFKEKTFEYLKALKAKGNSKALNDFIDEFIEKINKLDLKLVNDVYMLNESCNELLRTTFDAHEEEFPDPLIYPQLQKQYDALRDEETPIIDALDLIKSNIKKYKTDSKLDFEVDELYQIIKISKRSENLSFSVAFIADSSGKTTPYALYRGKERMLGSGGFGNVKLCQNLETGECCAIKIQQAIMRHISQPENAVLSAFDRFKGEMNRDHKYYSVQKLLQGVDLKKHLDSSDDEDLATRLMIAKKAISLVGSFHEKYLHRDIKPENFMWDPKSQELYLCDFGLACDIDHQGTFNDLSGSGTFLAPEIDDQYNRGRVNYSKKSDIYALGKTLEEVFKGVEIPSEISKMLESMTASDPGNRGDNMKLFLETVTSSIEQLEKPTLHL